MEATPNTNLYLPQLPQNPVTLSYRMYFSQVDQTVQIALRGYAESQLDCK